MVEESKNDPMYAAYQPHIITKEAILTASPAQMEMLLQGVVLVKDPIVLEKFKPTCVSSFNVIQYLQSPCSNHDKGQLMLGLNPHPMTTLQ